ncbi:MAG: glutamate racemase [Butyrivibrio sp.]|nr:glutamate racemase [Butyrivibrio sp.]
MKIGILDSGIGGLSVLNEAFHLLPGQEYIFYADTQHVPYGLKTEEQILSYVDDIIRFFIDKKVDSVVIACNTATSVAVAEMRKKYQLPIIGMEPAVKPAVENKEDDDKRVLVMATPVTIREKKLKNLLVRVDKDHSVDLLEMPQLVTFAERCEYDTEEVRKYLTDKFKDFDADKYDALVLGCTHFNYFKPMYRELLGKNIHLIDGNYGTIHHLGDVLGLEISGEDKELVFDQPQDIVVGYNTTYYESGNEITDNKSLLKIASMLSRLEYVRKIK